MNPDARRIRDLRHFGKTVEDDDLFIVATNSYRASGGGGFAGAQVGNTVYEAPDMVRDVLLQYIADRGGVRDLTLGTWSLPPLPNTSAIFESAPAGAARIPALPHGRIDHLGPGTAGFDRYRLRF